MNSSSAGAPPPRETSEGPKSAAVRRLPEDVVGRRRRVSLATTADEVSPAIRPMGSFPIFASTLVEGVDIVCAGCQEFVLASNVLTEQLRGIVLLCPVCGARNKATELQLDEPVNPSRSLVLTERETVVGHTVAVDPSTLWVSMADAEAFAIRTGYRGRWRVVRWHPLEAAIDPVTRLRADRLLPPSEYDLSGVRTLMGLWERLAHGFPSSLQPSIEAIMAGTAKSATIAGHPLLFALERVLEEARNQNMEINTGNPYLTLLLHSAYVFQRWRNHPRYTTLCRRLSDPTEFAHNASQLVIASILQDLGNGVTLAPGSSERRSCDLWVAGGPANVVSLEVKARHELRTLRPGLRPDQAAKVVREAVDSAGFGKGGQLDPSRPGILGLGGFMLTPEDLATLLKQAQLQMREWQGQARHVAAVFAASVGSNLSGHASPLIPTSGINLRSLQGHVVNPEYEGSVLLRPLSFAPVISQGE